MFGDVLPIASHVLKLNLVNLMAGIRRRATCNAAEFQVFTLFFVGFHLFFKEPGHVSRHFDLT